MTLAEFLKARLDEDEEAAQRCPGIDFSIAENPKKPGFFEMEAYAPGSLDRFDSVQADIPSPYAQHIARHDPARVLAEVDAKRLLLALHKECGASCYVVRVLALPYASHPDYREEWKP